MKNTNQSDITQQLTADLKELEAMGIPEGLEQPNENDITDIMKKLKASGLTEEDFEKMVMTGKDSVKIADKPIKHPVVKLTAPKKKLPRQNPSARLRQNKHTSQKRKEKTTLNLELTYDKVKEMIEYDVKIRKEGIEIVVPEGTDNKELSKIINKKVLEKFNYPTTEQAIKKYMQYTQYVYDIDEDTRKLIDSVGENEKVTDITDDIDDTLVVDSTETDVSVDEYDLNLEVN